MDTYHIDGHKLFWHLDRVSDWQKGMLVPPVYIEVSPLSLCNHRCIFCGIDFVRDKDLRLDTAIFSRRLREMGELGVRSVMFAGEGEPLLHKDLGTFIKTAKSSGMDVSLTTNGALGNYAIWKDILPHLTWIRFSVDAGDAKCYAKVHGVSEREFHKTIKSIGDAVRVKRDGKLPVTIGVQYLMVDENISGIGDALRLFSDLGVDYFSLKPYSLHPQMKRRKEVLYTKATAARVRGIIEIFKKKSRMKIIFRDDALMRYMGRGDRFCHCRALPFWGYVSSGGDFYTCSVFIGDKRFKAGNIHEKNMKSILLGTKRRESIDYAATRLSVGKECRVNCRMARVNEFLEFIEKRPEHVNFI